MFDERVTSFMITWTYLERLSLVKMFFATKYNISSRNYLSTHKFFSNFAQIIIISYQIFVIFYRELFEVVGNYKEIYGII